MANAPRRRFLKSSAGLVSGLALSSCTPGERAAPAVGPVLDRTTLDALAEVVLPKTALGESGVGRVVAGFVAWLDGFEPVAERNHPYLWTDDILYGPADPGPQWASQLSALELESDKRHGMRFPELSASERHSILSNQLPGNLESDLPYAGDAAHVAVGLLAYFYQTPEANDLAYGAAIEKQTCRGLDTGPDEPAPLESTGG